MFGSLVCEDFCPSYFDGSSRCGFHTVMACWKVWPLVIV